QVRNPGYAHAAQPLFQFVGTVARWPRKANSRAGDSQSPNQGAISLAPKLRRITMRASLDPFPSAPRRLDNPIVDLGGAAGHRTEHFPVVFDIGIALTNPAQ